MYEIRVAGCTVFLEMEITAGDCGMRGLVVHSLDRMHRRPLLPGSCLAVYAVGCRVEGWGGGADTVLGSGFKDRRSGCSTGVWGYRAKNRI